MNSRITRSILILLTFTCITKTSEGESRTTFPTPPKLKKANRLDMNIAQDIPYDTKGLAFVVAIPGRVPDTVSKIAEASEAPGAAAKPLAAGKGTGEAPLYAFYDMTSAPSYVGSLALGTAVKLDLYRLWNGRIYYAIPYPSALQKPGHVSPPYAYLDGLYLKATESSASAK